ncbi:MAG: MBOAT family protein [Magnetococcales bacterium]|nr:MBOAT family protein [Magnetococcales bacterium]NGZ07221.1 MBOAT family protein [Magnetococcales bacterium]
MIFHSIDFLIFLLAALTIYWQLSSRHQLYFLLLASGFFYGYIHPWFLYPLLVTSTIDFGVALAMERYPDHRQRLLLISLVANLGLLSIFKYFGFFVENVHTLLSWFGIAPVRLVLEILLPVGISFYTFQSISYTVDVYRGRIPACHNWVEFAVYVSFFPQLVAGPIGRAGEILPQVQRPRIVTAVTIRSGLVLITWGFFEKLVIADNVALIVNNVFLLQDPPFWVLWAGVFAFTIQILADFAGYTDIARGVARLFGIELSRNFHHPYLATSPQEFWQRWHISLSNWIRDYLYIPLGGSRVVAGRYVFNILVTFFLCGLWHGASWNFVLWGVFHGVLIIVYRVAGTMRPLLALGKIPGMNVARWLLMFVLTQFGWLIFRETDLTCLMHYLTLSPFTDTAREHEYAWFLFAKAFYYSIFLWLHAWVELYLAPRLTTWPRIHYWGEVTTVTLLFLGILNLRGFQRVDFIYFQF